MMNWRILPQSVGSLIAALSLFACASAQAPEAPPSQTVIAIGDLHGDYEAYENLMRAAGLIDKRGRWSGGDRIFVQTGDVPDRGPDSLKIMRHLQKLQTQAQRKGGKVVTLVGNHEAMNVTGDLRYVHPGEYEAFTNRNSRRLRDAVYESNREAIEASYLDRDATLSSVDIKAQWEAVTPIGMIEHQRAWRVGGDVGDWIVENPAVAIIGDSLFVHGGISEKYAAFSVDEMNEMTAEALTARDIDPESIINDEAGPLWYRGLVMRVDVAETPDDEEPAPASIAPLSVEDEIALVLETFDVQRIVVGHTPSLSGIKASHDGKLIQIDTGISAHYDGAHSYLRIEDGVVYANDNGVETIIEE